MKKELAANGMLSYSRKSRQIVSRHYNLIVRKGEEVVEVAEYLTLSQARNLKAEYKADGYSCDIIEDVSIDQNGKEITFTPRKPKEVETRPAIGMGTPEATKSKVERDRKRMQERRKRPTLGRAIETRVTNGWRNPASSLHSMWKEMMRREGFEVFEKRVDGSNGMRVFRGNQKETVQFIRKNKYNLNSLNIVYVGR